jgi:hypothetical protein
VFIEPGNSGFSTKRTMPPDVVPIVNIGRQVFAQFIEEPRIRPRIAGAP